MRAAARWAIALACALAAGVAISCGQTLAPDWLAPLANSAAPVVAVAGLVAFAARRWWTSVLIGALAGPAVMAGYYLTSHVRGFGVSSSWVALWCTAGALFGGAMGLAVWVLLSRRPTLPTSAAAALWPGVALGEAAHGLVRIADSTPTGYWQAQATIGVVVLAATAWKHLPMWGGRALAAAFTAAVAAVVFAAYGTI